MLDLDDGLEAKTLFEYLQREDPGRFADGQLRTLQRRVKVWRALVCISVKVATCFGLKVATPRSVATLVWLGWVSGFFPSRVL
jgi:hypothetical protein